MLARLVPNSRASHSQSHSQVTRNKPEPDKPPGHCHSVTRQEASQQPESSHPGAAGATQRATLDDSPEPLRRRSPRTVTCGKAAGTWTQAAELGWKHHGHQFGRFLCQVACPRGFRTASGQSRAVNMTLSHAKYISIYI
jgi:hypothetical protein